MGYTPQLFANSREQGGHKARHAGKAFESLVLHSQTDGRGTFVKLVQIKNFAKRIYAPSHPGGPKEMRLIEERSPFDFTGSVWGSGIGVHFDCKSLGPDVASFPTCDEKVVKPHQIDALQSLEAAGAFAGFLVECHRKQDWRWLWASKANKTKRIQWDDPVWHVLGSIMPGCAIPLRKLFEAYK